MLTQRVSVPMLTQGVSVPMVKREIEFNVRGELEMLAQQDLVPTNQ